MVELIESTGEFASSDGVRIFYRHYQAESEKARMVIAHFLPSAAADSSLISPPVKSMVSQPDCQGVFLPFSFSRSTNTRLRSSMNAASSCGVSLTNYGIAL